MSYYTDGSTLPGSTLESWSDSPSSCVQSSLGYEIKKLDFLNNSWPFLDRISDTRFSDSALTADDVDVDSWNFQEFPEFENQPKKCDVLGVSSGGSSIQKSPHSARQKYGTPSSLNSSGCSPDASILYNSTGKHYNPSASGPRAHQELEDYSYWIKSCLQYSTRSEDVTDISKALADGRTLIDLVEILLGITIRPAHVKPVLDVQKTENIGICLDVLQRHGVPVKDVDTEDIVKENRKAVLVLCQCLYKHFGSFTGSLGTATPQSFHRTPSPRIISSVVVPSTNRGCDWYTSSHSSEKSPIDVDDVALLDWVANLTGQPLDGYESFQDGHILCLLINRLTDNAVPEVVLEYGIPSEKISLALTFSRDELGVSTKLEPEDIWNPTDTTEFYLYLKALHRIFLEHKAQETTYLKKSQENMEMKTMSTEEWNDGQINRTERLQTPTMNQVQYKEVDKTISTFRRKSRTSSNSNILPITKDSKEHSVFSFANKGILSQDNSRIERTSNFSQDESIEENHNAENGYRRPITLTPRYFNEENLEEEPVKQSTSIKLESKLFAGEDVAWNVHLRESLFDQENWKSEPIVSRSWKKQREKAKTKLDFLNQQVILLKEDYFKYSLIEESKSAKPEEIENDRLRDNNCHLSSNKSIENSIQATPNCPNSRTILMMPEQTHVSKYTSKILSEPLNTILRANKGTTPPYRTWSRYVNTDGDRYKLCSKKIKELSSKKITELSHDDVNNSHRYVGGEVPRNKPKKQVSLPNDNWPSISPQITRNQAKHLSDNDDMSIGSTSSQEAIGCQLHGITALVRLCSKKANATSEDKS